MDETQLAQAAGDHVARGAVLDRLDDGRPVQRQPGQRNWTIQRATPNWEQLSIVASRTPAMLTGSGAAVG
jgi:hypothetical protein